jgi:hypothetical protein
MKVGRLIELKYIIDLGKFRSDHIISFESTQCLYMAFCYRKVKAFITLHCTAHHKSCIIKPA